MSISIIFRHSYLILQSCWISTENGAIWGFVVPILAIIVVRFVYSILMLYVCLLFVIQVNVIFLLLSLRSLYRSRKNTYRMKIQEASQPKLVRYVAK